MRKDIDILLDENGDLLLDGNGDPVVGDVTQQNQKLLLETRKGDWKLYPLIGVGVQDFVDDEDPGALMREIRLQLKKDGFKIGSLKINGQTIKIDAKY